MTFDYDYIVIGSGFGGSVSALRLSQKGYKVLVLEKGRWLKANDFPKSNWNLKRWLWMPFLHFYGLFKITFFRHVTTLSGVGVGGGSLVYANTLPIPTKAFFTSRSWRHLADWQKELAPFYEIAKKMMGVAVNPRLMTGDNILQKIAKERGQADAFRPTDVAVFFGEADKTVPDPYFNGDGPERSGCNFCGGCMLGCRYNAKNTLDKNYLYFAQKEGAVIQAESEVYDIKHLNGQSGVHGYTVFFKKSRRFIKKRDQFTTRGVVFAGGVLGTVKLLLKLKSSSLPLLSARVGHNIRTNSESLTGVTTSDKDTVFSDGIAIGSIYHLDANSHVEPVRYPAGSGFWRLLMAPLVYGPNIFVRVIKLVGDYIWYPLENLRTHFVSDWAKKTQILLFMQTLDSTLRFTKTWFGMGSKHDRGKPATSFIPEAGQLARDFAQQAGGKATALLTESLLGIPTTAHILGGCAMGTSSAKGVIDSQNRVFGCPDMYICDGSVFSANPGVNPSLTILAISERAMSFIPPKDEEASNNK